jgi:pectate lyase
MCPQFFFPLYPEIIKKAITEMRFTKFIASTAIVILAGYQLIKGQVPAFPDAEGYGKYTSGGRGGSVYEVTNLNDSGPGSFRDAVSQSNRTIVFRVSGDIELQSTIHIQSSNLTIAGQTAPGDGICIRDYPTIIRGANNIILRYVRFRLGDRYGLNSDAFGIDNGCQNIIVDHCTMSWGVDECFSTYHGNPKYITVQWCIVGEGLDLNGHSMGGLWGGHTSYHHNLVHTNNSRHPKYNSDSDPTDSRNNVIYNWRANSAYTGSQGKVNLVNNYYKAGPATGSLKHRIVQASDTFRMYISGNYVAGYPAITADNWNGGVDDPPIRHHEPFDVPYPIPEQSAVDAYHEVIRHVGASFPRRDDADNRAIKNLVDSTGSILVRQSDAGGFPRLYSLPAPDDTDHDGMPDDWEDAEGLDKNDPEDRNGDKNGNGYTNLEDYLNGLPRLPDDYPKPGFPSAETVSEYRINVLWYDHNTDESGFILERSTDSISYSFLDTLPAGTGSYIDSLALPSTDYYYRVRSFNDTEESIWAYSTATRTFAEGAMPGQAVMLAPDDNQEEISISGTTLRWEAGEYTLSFNVYMGVSESELELKDSATTSTSYKTYGLDFGTDYYWRIDANNFNGTTTGQVRKFSAVEEAVPELVLYWPFREQDGNIVYDSTENQNHGSLKNVPTLIRGDGPFDRSISLSNSGPTGHIELPDSPGISFGENPFSIAFWMRLESVSDSSVYIFHKGAFRSIDGTERNGRWFGLEMRGGSFRFAVDDNSTKTTVSSSTSSFVTGEWVHVVIIRDPFKQRLYLYKNNFVNKVNADATGDISQSLPLVVGNSDHMYPEYYDGNTDENAPFRGELAEFIICRHPLSGEEIDLLYTHNRIPTLPPPLSDRSPAGITGLMTWPNPFSQGVSIRFANGTRNHVMLEVYDINGKLVFSKRKPVIPNSGNRIYWDGTSADGARISSGTYLLMLREESGLVLGRAVLMKK